MAGVRARVKRHDRFGYYAYYRDLPLVSGDRTLFWFLDPDIAYAFPQDDGLTLLAVFQTQDRVAWFKRDLEANFERSFDGLPNAPDLAGATRMSKILGGSGWRTRCGRRPSRAGLRRRRGAGRRSPWGVGCGFAFQSGEWLAEELGGAGRRRDAEVDAAAGALPQAASSRAARPLPAHLGLLDRASPQPDREAALLRRREGPGRRRRLPRVRLALGQAERRGLRTIGRALDSSQRHATQTAGVETPTGAHADGPPLPAAVARTRVTSTG